MRVEGISRGAYGHRRANRETKRALSTCETPLVSRCWSKPCNGASMCFEGSSRGTYGLRRAGSETGYVHNACKFGLVVAFWK